MASVRVLVFSVWTVSFSLWTKFSQTLLSVLCITANKYLVCVLVVLLHARFRLSPRSNTFSIGRHFLGGHPGYACGQVVMIKTGNLWELMHTYYYGNNTLGCILVAN